MLTLALPRLGVRPLAGARRSAAPRRVASAPLCAHRPTVAFVTEKQESAAVDVRFTLQKHVPFGQELMVVGDSAALGAWDVGAAVRMSWSEGDVWHATVRLPAGASLEFKFVQAVPNSMPQWESCLNRTLCVDASTTDLTCVWGAPLATVAAPAASAGDAAAAGVAGVESEDDAPAPAFKPAAALAQFADAVKQSLSGNSSVDVPQAAAPAAQQPSLLAAAVEALSGPSGADPLGPPAVRAASPVPAAPAASQAEGSREGSAAPPKGGKEVRMSAAAAAAVTDIIEGSGPTPVGVPADGGAAAPAVVDAGAEADDLEELSMKPAAPAAASKSGGTTLKTLGTAVGTVAMGVGAAAMLSTLAIDIGDVALLGAVAAGSVAALSTPTTASGKKARSGRRGKAAAGAKGADAATVEEEAAADAASAMETEMIAQKASAPGVILAAGVLSAFDAGRKMMADVSESQAESAAAAQKKKNKKQ